MSLIQQAVEKFIKAGDSSSTEHLEEVLHKNYQNIQDGFFDQKGIFIFSKEQYIELVRSKTFGGKPRTIIYHSIEQKGNIAMVQVTLESTALQFSSTITCVHENDEWLVITNIPSIKEI